MLCRHSPACLQRHAFIGLSAAAQPAPAVNHCTVHALKHVCRCQGRHVPVRAVCALAKLFVSQGVCLLPSCMHAGDYNASPDRHLGAATLERLRPDVIITEVRGRVIARQDVHVYQKDVSVVMLITCMRSSCGHPQPCSIHSHACMSAISCGLLVMRCAHCCIS